MIIAGDDDAVTVGRFSHATFRASISMMLSRSSLASGHIRSPSANRASASTQVKDRAPASRIARVRPPGPGANFNNRSTLDRTSCERRSTQDVGIEEKVLPQGFAGPGLRQFRAIIHYRHPGSISFCGQD